MPVGKTTVLVSPLRRARETAELAGLAARAQVEPALHEWDDGAYEGLWTKEVRVQRPHCRRVELPTVAGLA